MSGELRLVKRAPSQTSCFLFVFFFRSGIPSVQRLHIFTQFRATSIHYVKMCSDVFFVLCYFILDFHFLHPIWLRPLFCPVGIWILVCIADGTVRHRKFAVHVEQKCRSRSSISVNSLIMGSAFCSP